jgi:hypothetical protein
MFGLWLNCAIMLWYKLQGYFLFKVFKNLTSTNVTKLCYLLTECVVTMQNEVHLCQQYRSSSKLKTVLEEHVLQPRRSWSPCSLISNRCCTALSGASSPVDRAPVRSRSEQKYMGSVITEQLGILMASVMFKLVCSLPLYRRSNNSNNILAW